eukprot:gene2333-2801_t
MNVTNSTVYANPSMIPLVEDESAITFMFINSCLVLFMTPGLSFFYSGMIKSKNSASMIAQSFIAHIIVSVVWWFCGFSLAFSGGPFYGNFDFIMLLRGEFLSTSHVNAPGVPLLLFCMYQCMFASITPALISGSMAERTRFRTYCVFVALWMIFVYCPAAHIIWHPEGFLYKLGILDFAGGLVVHLSSGASAMIFAIFLRRRKGYYNIVDVFEKYFGILYAKVTGKPQPIENLPVQEEQGEPKEHRNLMDRIKDLPSAGGDFYGHSISVLCIGTGILWVGWFGFNGGSSMTPNRVGVIGLVNTNFAGAVSGLTWMILAMIHHRGKAPIVEICNGAICGLAAVTPGAGFIAPGYAALCGFTSAIISFYFVRVKVWLMDDSLDAFAIHGIQGIYGTLFAGLFASKDIAATGGLTIGGGWIDGNFVQLAIQLLGVTFIFAWSAVITFILFLILAVVPGLGWRISDYEERIGLDQSQHGEDSYVFEDLEDLNYIDGEKPEGLKNCTKLLFHDFYVEHEKRPPKKFFTKPSDHSASKVSLTDNNVVQDKVEELHIQQEIEMKDVEHIETSHEKTEIITTVPSSDNLHDEVKIEETQ